MDAPKATIVRARSLRRTLSPPEVRLWCVLRGGAAAGLRFRRQHPIGPFVLDFYCDGVRLAVEVDGEQHGFAEHRRRDIQRDAWLERHGVAMLRIPAVEVRDNLDGVVLRIVDVARARALCIVADAAQSPPPPLRGYSPQRGERGDHR